MVRQDVKRIFKQNKVKQWGTFLLVSFLVAGALAFLPMPAQAATTGWGPWHLFGGDRVLPGFWVTGEVVEVDGESVTLELPNHRHAHGGMMEHISLQVTMDVISDTVLLDGELAPMEVGTLEAGDEVVVAPRIVWGNLVVRLLYVGEPGDLVDATYTGRLAEQDGDTLTLETGRHDELTVIVDDNTVWYDNGQMERPAELPKEMKLRVLGIEEEIDSEDGEDEQVIRAVLITPGRGY